MNFTNGAAVTVTGSGLVTHQNLGDSDNRGQIFVTGGSSFSLSGVGTTLDLTSGSLGDLNVFGSQLDISDQAAIQVNTLRINDSGTTAAFNNATVTAGVLGLNAGSTATAAQGTQLNSLSRVDVIGGSTLTLQDAGTQMDVGNIEVGGAGSRLNIESGATVNATAGRILEGELAVNNGTLNMTGTLRSGEAGTPSGTLALSNGAQLNVGGELFVEATLTAQDSTLTVAQRLDVTDGQVTLTASSANVGNLEIRGNSTLHLTDTQLEIQDGARVSGGTLTQSGGATVFGDEVNFTNGAAVTVTGSGLVTHQNLGDSDNRGQIFVTGGSSFSLSGAGTTLNLTSGSLGDLNVITGSQLDISDQAAIQVNTLRINDSGTTAAFNNATVTAGVLGLNAGSTATAAQGTQLNVMNGLSRVDITEGSTLTLQDTGTQMALGNIEVGGAGSRLNIESGATVNAGSGRILQGELAVDNGVLNVAGTLRSGEAGTPSGTLALRNNAQLDVGGDLFVEATLTGQDSTLTVDQRLAVTNGQVTLTGSSANIGSLEFGGNSTLNLTDTQLTIQDGALVSGGTLTQSGGATVFGDEVTFTNGAAVTVTGSGLVTHQDLGDGDNRGHIFVTDDSSFSLSGTGTTLDLTSGGGQFGDLNVFTGSQLNVSDQATVNVNAMRVGGANSTATFDHSTLTAESLDLTDGAIFTATLSAIDITGNTTTIDATSQMVLNGGTYDEAADFIVNGQLTGTNPVIDIGSDLIINNGGSVRFSGFASLLIGDDLLFFDNPGILNLGLTTITMRGLDDDDEDGFRFDLGPDFSGILDLGKLIVGVVDLILKGNFQISELILPEGAEILLADNSVLTVNRFTGNEDSITGGTFNNNTPAVPEPTTLLLFGMGLLGLLGYRRFQKIG